VVEVINETYIVNGEILCLLEGERAERVRTVYLCERFIRYCVR
jgi:hypothetical protein